MVVTGKHRRWSTLSQLLVPLWLSWLGVWLAPFIARWLPGPHSQEPRVPLVSLPVELQGDVQSSVPALVYCMLVVALVALPVEITKAQLSGTRRGGAYCALLVYQAMLASDVMRLHANDWWTYLLSQLGIAGSAGVDANAAPPILPWPSFLLLLFASTIVWRYERAASVTARP